MNTPMIKTLVFLAVSSLAGSSLTACAVSDKPVSDIAANQASDTQNIDIVSVETPIRPTLPEPPALPLPPLADTNYSENGNKILIDPAADEQTRLARQANFAEAMSLVEERQKVFASTTERFTLVGVHSQAGLLFGQTEPGSKVRLDGSDIMVDDAGRFVLGFGRDSALTALLLVTLPDGEVKRHTIELADKDFPEQRIDGLDQSKVSGFTEAQLVKIRADQALFKQARSKTQNGADWVAGFDWPVTGRISGVFGSRRILNGEPKRPHSGVDVARPTGTPILAPAGGVVTLAEPDMYFGGGTVLLDHGHWIESAFLHMSELNVEVGQRVEKGELLGLVGATGRVTGPHLHWSVRWLALNRLVDPQLLAGEMPAPEAESTTE